MADDTDYPIAFRHKVPPKTNILQTMKSRLKEIPTDRRDFAVILDFEGIYELVPSGTPIASAQGLKAATAMVFVDIRAAFIDIELSLPCVGHVERRNVHVRYRSQVVAAEVVVEDRVDQLKDTLESWTRALLRRESLLFTSADYGAFDASARNILMPRLMEDPPVSPAGIEIKLVEISSELPEKLLRHEETLIDKTRDTERRVHDTREDERAARERRGTDHQIRLEQSEDHELEWQARQSLEDKKRDKGVWQQDEDAKRLEEAYSRGPQAVLALMASKNPEYMNQLVEHGIQDRNFLANLLLQAADSGVVSNSVVEDLLTDAANRMLEGSGAQVGTGRSSSVIADGTVRGTSSNSTKDDDFDPEDDGLDDEVIDSLLEDDGSIANLFANDDGQTTSPKTSSNPAGPRPDPDPIPSDADGDDGVSSSVGAGDNGDTSDYRSDVVDTPDQTASEPHEKVNDG